MATKAHLEGNKRYHETLDEIKIRVRKGRKAEIQASADGEGQSLNSFITQAINERIEQIKESNANENREATS